MRYNSCCLVYELKALMPRLLNSSEGAIFKFVNCENTSEESQMPSQSVGPNHSQSSFSTELLPETKGRDFPEKEICL